MRIDEAQNLNIGDIIRYGGVTCKVEKITEPYPIGLNGGVTMWVTMVLNDLHKDEKFVCDIVAHRHIRVMV